jgi:hypothetical protein
MRETRIPLAFFNPTIWVDSTGSKHFGAASAAAPRQPPRIGRWILKEPRGVKTERPKTLRFS